GQAALARTVLGELVDEEILVQKAKELKLEVTDADITAGADRQIKQVRGQFRSDDEYRNELKRLGLDRRRNIVNRSSSSTADRTFSRRRSPSCGRKPNR